MTAPMVDYKIHWLKMMSVPESRAVVGRHDGINGRDSDAVEEGGVEALLERTRRVPNPKNRVDLETEEAVVAYAVEYPAHGQVRVSSELRKRGVFMSPSGVRSIWLRHDLAHFKARLKALEAKVAEEGIILAEAQIQALEKKNWTTRPGAKSTPRISQDTFYVGTLKGVGRVYQQTYIDTYAKVAQAKLYKSKTPITAADMLNDKVLPFHEQHELPALRILTDRGTEYCGRADRHDYQLFLAVNDIDHTKTKVKSPQTNGICERFHKTILQELYQVTFRKKIYETIEQLQNELDEWIDHYNNERTHQGKICEGRTPMQTLEEGKAIWREKFVA